MLLRLQLLSTGDFFVLSKDDTLTVDINSSFFNAQSDFIGSYSYTGKMPLEGNKRMIRNAQLISTDAGLRTVDVLMWLGYLPYKQVKMYFTIEDGSIDYNLYIDASLIVNQLKTLTLDQLEVPADDTQLNLGTPAALKAYMMATTTAVPGGLPMVFFPYKNDGAYKDAAYLAYNNYLPAHPYAAGEEFRYLNNHIYQVTAVTAAGQTPDTNPEKFTDITLDADLLQPAYPIINRWEIDGSFNGYFTIDANFPVNQTQTPFFLVTFAIKRILKFFGYSWIGKWMSEEQANRLTIFSNIAVGYGSQIADFRLFMPKILVSDFLKEIRAQFGILIDFDATRNTCVVESLANLTGNSEVIDLRSQQTVSFREISNSSQAFTVSQTADDKDKAYSDNDKINLPVLQVGDVATAQQETDITLLSVSTKMLTEPMPCLSTLPVPIVSNYRIPYIKMPIYGSTPLDQISTVELADRDAYKLRFLYYHGMVANDAGYLYPYGSSDNLDVNNNKLTDFTLALNADSTAYLSVLAYYTFQLLSKPFEMVFNLNQRQYNAIRANKRVLVRDFNQANIRCLLSQQSADFEPGKDLITTKLTLYPIIQPKNSAQVLPVVPEAPPAPPVDNGLVYVRFRVANITANHYLYPPPERWEHNEDLYVDFFADAFGATPKAVVNLAIKLQITEVIDGDLSSAVIGYDNITANGSSQLLLSQVLADSTQAGHSYDYRYQLSPTAHYTIIA